MRESDGLIRRRGADYLAYALLDAAVDAYFPLLEVFGDRLEELEDAVILARAVAATPDIATAFRAYSDVRRPRTQKVAAASRRNGIIYQLEGAAAIPRNAVLRMASGASIMKRYDWLYGMRP